MKICVVTPAARGSRKGNRITAERWAAIFRQLGHRVVVVERLDDRDCDVLVALHARRSHQSIKRFRTLHPQSPLVVTLTGTDVYHDLPTNQAARRSLEMATALVVLQPAAVARLPKSVHHKTHVIFQSVTPPPHRRRATNRTARRSFDICLLAHLRPVKDPLRAAMAARRLPPSSRIRIVHMGAALSDSMRARVEAESRRNKRYCWKGDVPRSRALRVLSGCRALVLTSKMEGGANAVSEAIAMSVPVLSTHIDGSVGMLGEDYPGYFPTGDTLALTKLMGRLETDRAFERDLRRRCALKRPLFRPARERRSWADLLRSLDRV